MSEFEHVGTIAEAVVESLRRAKDAYEKARASVIPSACASCAIDSPSQLACNFSEDSGCKHAAIFEARLRAKSMGARCRAAKVPGKYADEVTSIEPCAALAAVRRVLHGAPAAILLGNPGSGKTLAACYGLAERGGLFCPASSLDVLSGDAASLVERLCSEPLIVLDDVGQGRSATDLALDRTENILCRRADAGLPSIVTANLTSSQFWALPAIRGGRVLDRLGEGSIALCREPSRRKALRVMSGAGGSLPPPNERGER